MSRPPPLPPGAAATTLRHRVPFFDTDAMGVVHHANYARYLELARVRWMDEHHRPYRTYVALGLHFAVTRLLVDYHAAAGFDDVLDVTVWLASVRGASLVMSYQIVRDDALLVTASTEHAMVDGAGRVRRIPAELRGELRALAGGAS